MEPSCVIEEAQDDALASSSAGEAPRAEASSEPVAGGGAAGSEDALAAAAAGPAAAAPAAAAAPIPMTPPEAAEALTPDGGVLKGVLEAGSGDVPCAHARCLGEHGGRPERALAAQAHSGAPFLAVAARLQQLLPAGVSRQPWCSKAHLTWVDSWASERGLLRACARERGPPMSAMSARRCPAPPSPQCTTWVTLRLPGKCSWTRVATPTAASPRCWWPAVVRRAALGGTQRAGDRGGEGAEVRLLQPVPPARATCRERCQAADTTGGPAPARSR